MPDRDPVVPMVGHVAPGMIGPYRKTGRREHPVVSVAETCAYGRLRRPCRRQQEIPVPAQLSGVLPVTVPVVTVSVLPALRL